MERHPESHRMQPRDDCQGGQAAGTDSGLAAGFFHTAPRRVPLKAGPRGRGTGETPFAAVTSYPSNL